MLEKENLDEFVSKKVNFQKNRFISYTCLKVPKDMWFDDNEIRDDVLVVNEKWYITCDWALYLLEKYDSLWEKENFFYDKWFYKWYLEWIEDLLKFISFKN